MAGFAQRYSAFQAAEIDVVAASVDSIADAKKLVDEQSILFPVAYGLDAETTARLLGGFYEPAPDGAFLHPATFIVLPNGRIISSTYSSAAVGRLEAEDALRFIEFKKKRPPPFA